MEGPFQLWKLSFKQTKIDSKTSDSFNSGWAKWVV